MAGTPSVAVRAAASSMASGMPSSRRQSSTIAARSNVARSTPAAAARCRNSSTAVVAGSSDRTASTCSPSTPEDLTTGRDDRQVGALAP